ncbi:MAG: tyrosine-type recombinase/integrase [Bacillota bacterium]
MQPSESTTGLLNGADRRRIGGEKHTPSLADGWLPLTTKKDGGDLGGLTRFDAQSYVKHLEASGNSATITGKTFAAMNAFAAFVERPDVVQNVRIPEVRKLRNIAPKSLERTDRNRVLREVERDGNVRDVAILYTLLYTGLRVSELVALNREDVTMKERSGWLIVENGKGYVARKVPLSAELRLHLSRYLDTRKDGDQALFLSNYRQRISVRTVQHMASKYGIHPHELRHTFCRELVGAGIEIVTVAELAGHADVNVTRRYSMPTEADLEKAIDKAFC